MACALMWRGRSPRREVEVGTWKRHCPGRGIENVWELTGKGFRWTGLGMPGMLMGLS